MSMSPKRKQTDGARGGERKPTSGERLTRMGRDEYFMGIALAVRERAD
jgi:hypothetical protein